MIQSRYKQTNTPIVQCALHDLEFRISEALGALSDPKLSGSGTETSGIYPNFRTSDGSLVLMHLYCNQL